MLFWIVVIALGVLVGGLLFQAMMEDLRLGCRCVTTLVLAPALGYYSC